MKILFLQEYIRESHMKQEGEGWKNVFMSTKGGQILRKLVESESGLNLKRSNYYLDYAYSLVPKVIARDKYDRATKYKPPTQKEAGPEYEYLFKRIVKEKPDIIIPTGNLGCKALLGKAAISSLRGVPQKVTVTAKTEEMDIGPAAYLHPDDLLPLQEKLDNAEQSIVVFHKLYSSERLEKSAELRRELNTLECDAEELRKQINAKPASTDTEHTCWVLPMYSMEYMLVNPSVQNLIEADFVTLNKFVEQGESAFESSPVEYEFVTDINRVREIFTKEIPAAPMTSWDLETNTLRGELPGAKPLVISLCWEEGTGVTVPLEHKEHQWLPGHLAEIYKYIEAFVANPAIPKVGHNI